MKSQTLHKYPSFVMLLLLMLLLLPIDGAWSQPLNIKPQDAQPQQQQQPLLFIQSNANVEDSKNYEITVPKDAKEGQPCLTMTWKNNPDGSEPDFPQIYMVNGYFMVKPPAAKQQRTRT